MERFINAADFIPLPEGQESKARVAEPCFVISLGTTGCKIGYGLQTKTSDWSQEDKKKLRFLYMDANADTAGIVPQGSFIPLSIPHLQGLTGTEGWITECLPELRFIPTSGKGALRHLSFGGLFARYQYSEISNHIATGIEALAPIYGDKTSIRTHIISFLGGGTIGALPVLLAALSNANKAPYHITTILHLVLPDKNMKGQTDNIYQHQLRNAYVMLEFLRFAGGAALPPVEGDVISDAYTTEVFPNKQIKAIGEKFALALLYATPAPSRGEDVQAAYVARNIEHLIADASGIGQAFWPRFEEDMVGEDVENPGRRFGSANSREIALPDEFFTMAAKRHLQRLWTKNG